MNINNKNTKSSNDLYSELKRAGDIKHKYSQDIKQSVKNNKRVIKKSQSSATIQIKDSYLPRIQLRKQKSLMQISKSINQRIKIDRQAKIKLVQITDEYSGKKSKIQTRIEEVKKRNLNRMGQLNQVKGKYLKKLNKQYLKDKGREQNLLAEYQFVLKQEGRLKETEIYRKQIQEEDWLEILKEKKILQEMVHNYTRKQENLIRDQNPEQLQRLKYGLQVQLKQEKMENEKPSLPRIKGNAKQIGNQYLQYAKKIKDLPKEKGKLKTLDINLKCIDYSSDIMDKIARNTGNLSRYRIQNNSMVSVRETKNSKNKPESPLKLPFFQVKEDEETNKYLKQIRSNIKQMEKND